MQRAAAGFPIWPCTRWGFPCLVACASSGALLPHLFTLTHALRRGRFILCGTVRRGISRFRRPRVSSLRRTKLRGIAPYGVRTFLLPLARKAILRLPKIVGKVIALTSGGKQRRAKLFSAWAGSGKGTSDGHAQEPHPNTIPAGAARASTAISLSWEGSTGRARLCVERVWRRWDGHRVEQPASPGLPDCRAAVLRRPRPCG